METMTTLQPRDFAQRLLNALEAAEGQTRRRKRDQGPDHIGLGLKRDLLDRLATADLAPDALEAWLLARVIEAPASGAVRAMCREILDDYRLAAVDPAFGQWLEQGAPSADAPQARGERREARGGTGRRPERGPETDTGGRRNGGPTERGSGGTSSGGGTSQVRPGDGPGRSAPRLSDDPILERPCCTVELLGSARLHAGVREVTVELDGAIAASDVVKALAARCPALVGIVLDPGRGAAVDGYILNRNGRDFIVDMRSLVQPGDRLLLLSSSAGG